MDFTDISTFIQSQLSSAPKPWLRIRGSHITTAASSQLEEDIDFDLKIDCSSHCNLTEIEVESSLDSGSTRTRIDISSCANNDSDAISALAVHHLQKDSASLSGLSIHKLVGNYATSLKVMGQIRSIAEAVGYKGDLAITLHDYFVPEVQGLGDAEEGAILEASWQLRWPDENAWAQRIKFAMATREVGWIDLEKVRVKELPNKFAVKDQSIKDSLKEVRQVDGLAI